MADGPGLRLVALAAQGPGRVELDGVVQPSITAALAAAGPGSIITVGRGRYGPDRETFPLRIPAAVTVAGPEPPRIPDEAKKHLPAPAPAELVADGTAVVIEEPDISLAHLKITNRRPGSSDTVEITGARRVRLDTCALTGSLRLHDVTDVDVVWTTVTHGRIRATDSTGVHLTGGSVTGTHGTRAVVEFVDVDDARVEAAAITDAGVGIEARTCTGVHVSGCAVLADHDAVAATDSREVTVSGNRLRGERAVHLTGCVDGEISANGIERADTAISLAGCTDVTIGHNHIADARRPVHEAPG